MASSIDPYVAATHRTLRNTQLHTLKPVVGVLIGKSATPLRPGEPGYDALSPGDAAKKIKGSEVDGELDAIVTSNNTKANKVTGGTTNAFIKQDSNGDLADGGTVITAFALTVLDDVDAETARITLGVQSAAAGSTIIETGTTAQRAGLHMSA